MTRQDNESSALYIAGRRTLWRIRSCEDEPERVISGAGLRAVASGTDIVAVALEDGRIALLGRYERTVDTQLEEPIESLLVLPGRSSGLLIGTEGAHLYRLSGESVRRVETFDALGCRELWHTPWGGPPAVRSMAATPDGWVYADIHVGSIMRSPDRGENWEPVKPELNEDVHQVATCPADANRVYANTAKAVFLSFDRGGSWEHRSAELNERYGRSIAVAPDDPDVLLATVSDGPHGDDVHGQLWLSEDAGRSWSHVREGFPESTRENINTFQVAFTADGTGWAAVGETLYVGQSRARRWQELRRMGEPVDMLAPAAVLTEQA